MVVPPETSQCCATSKNQAPSQLLTQSYNSQHAWPSYTQVYSAIEIRTHIIIRYLFLCIAKEANFHRKPQITHRTVFPTVL